MANILTRTQNGIVFDNIDNTEGTLQIPLKLTQSDEMLDYKLIDAVNIDWNNAYLPENCSYINSTGDLLSLIDQKLKELKEENEQQTTMMSWEYYDE